MGELQTEPFQFTFNGFLKVAFQGSRRYCQVTWNRDDRPPTYLVRDGTRAHHLGGRSA